MQKFGDSNHGIEMVLNEPYCPPPMFYHHNPERAKERKGAKSKVKEAIKSSLLYEN